MGMLPSQVSDIPASDFDLLLEYWSEEPWGPWRDNLHTAIIAREVRRTAFKGGLDLKNFMFKKPSEVLEASVKAKKGIFASLKMMAKKVKRSKIKSKK